MQYLGANVPQAWAAGTPFMLLQAMLGLQQDAPRGKLYVDPALPDWLPDVTLTDLRLGRRRFDIRFWRDGKDTLFKVLKGKHDAVELRSIAISANWPSGCQCPALSPSDRSRLGYIMTISEPEKDRAMPRLPASRRNSASCVRLPCLRLFAHAIRSAGDVERGEVLAREGRHRRLADGQVDVAVDGAVGVKAAKLAAAM